MTLTNKDKQDIREIILEQLAKQKKEILEEIDHKMDMRFKLFEKKIIRAIADIVGTLTDSLDDTYASKDTETDLVNTKEYLRALP